MIRSVLAVFLLAQLALLGCAPAGPQVDFGKPNQVIPNADLDYSFLKNIDQITPPYPANSSYQIGDLPTVKGQFTVNKYIVEYDGQSAEKGRVKFHDLLVIKLDQDNKVIDGYKYTLEWTDSPSLVLYRISNKGLILGPDLKLADLKFICVGRGK